MTVMYTFDEVVAMIESAEAEALSPSGLPVCDDSVRHYAKIGASLVMIELLRAETAKRLAGYEFFVCECGKVGDVDDARSNELYPEPRCQECWDMLCSQDPAGTDTLDADGDL